MYIFCPALASLWSVKTAVFLFLMHQGEQHSPNMGEAAETERALPSREKGNLSLTSF